MNWGEVPAYLRPIEKRDDPGLMCRCRWTPVMRHLWQVQIEMGSLDLYCADLIDWSAAPEEWIVTRSPLPAP